MNIYKDAMLAQGACNLGGLVRGWARAIEQLQEQARAEGKGTDWINQHPVNVLFAEQGLSPDRQRPELRQRLRGVSGAGAQVMTTRAEFLAELTELAKVLQPTIEDDYRASDDRDDDTPAMLVTIGADAKGWSWQTGDNSFTGGAYGYAHWGVCTLSREDEPAEFAEAILKDLEDTVDDEMVFFFDKVAT